MISCLFSLFPQYTNSTNSSESSHLIVCADFNSIINPIVFDNSNQSPKCEDVLFFNCYGCCISFSDSSYNQNLTLNKICCYHSSFYSPNSSIGLLENTKACFLFQNLTAVVLSQGDYFSSMFCNTKGGLIYNHNESYNYLKLYCSYYIDGTYVDEKERKGYEVRYFIANTICSEEHGMHFRHQSDYMASAHHIYNLTTNNSSEVLILEECAATITWFYLFENSPSNYSKFIVTNISKSYLDLRDSFFDKEFFGNDPNLTNTFAMYPSQIQMRQCYYQPQKECGGAYAQILKRAMPSLLKRSLCFLFNN